MPYSNDTIKTARNLYLKHVKVADIERETKVPRRTLYSWIEKQGWDSLIKSNTVLETLERKLTTLIENIDKSDNVERDLNIITKLQTAKEKELQLCNSEQTPNCSDGKNTDKTNQPNGEKTKQSPSGKRGKNDLRGIDKDELTAKLKNGLFQYQIDEWETREKRVRNYLKSRQIGWTYYFAREAFADAILTGTNKAFLSASRAQVDIFKAYIKSFANAWFDVELTGTKNIKIKTDHGDVTFYFLPTNSSTAQGVSGDVYIDECFWIKDFKKLKDLAGAIASHKHYRKTYFSTPSTKTHGAYALWNGDEYRKIQEQRPELPPFKMPTEKQLHKGVDCIDGVYRKIITIDDAIKGGCDLFDIKQLELENDPLTFNQLYRCKFIDDTNSAFALAELLAGGLADARWPDFKPKETRPFGNREVWVGYDPSRSRDSAVISVLAVPTKPGGKFRLLEKIRMDNKNWAYQVEVMRGIVNKYNVGYMGIDTTGAGSGVYERVLEFYPRATNLYYTVALKTRLVLKAQDIFSSHRFEYCASHTDIAPSFMAIKKQSSGNNITFVATRDSNIGHADVAWSIMHALINEGLNTTGKKGSSYTMETEQ